MKNKGHTLTYCQYDDQIYLYGGWDPLQWDYEKLYFSDLWTINSSWVWNKVDYLGIQPLPRRGHSAIYSTLPFNCLIIFGGIIEYNKFSNEMVLFDIVKTKWKTTESTGDIPHPMAWHSANLYKNYMYVFGGLLDSEGKCSSEIYQMSVINFEWKILKIDKNIEPRYGHTANLFEDCLIILGGMRQKTEAEKSQEDLELRRESKEIIDISAKSSTVSEGDLIEKHEAGEICINFDHFICISLSIL